MALGVKMAEIFEKKHTKKPMGKNTKKTLESVKMKNSKNWATSCFMLAP